MAVFELGDRPLPLAYCDATRTTATGTWVCVNKPCDGEGHYFVKADG